LAKISVGRRPRPPLSLRTALPEQIAIDLKSLWPHLACMSGSQRRLAAGLKKLVGIDKHAANVYLIAITGGPCAGKTTALERLAGFLRERSFRVFTVPEAATMLFSNGVSFADLSSDEKVATSCF